MTDEQVAKEMLKDFIHDRPINKYGYREGCPFLKKKDDNQLHELCAVLFPGWSKKYLKSVKMGLLKCPCTVMSKSYIKRTARRFAKNG